ncbi:MAG: PilT/PilU family type 4a pilus ATPase, partial [Oxalobacteraceae bacterium]
MTTLEELVARALEAGASDLHIEPLQAVGMRVKGELVMTSVICTAEDTEMMARIVLQDTAWRAFLERRSADLSLLVSGIRCRINVMRSMAGVGLVVRLLSRFGQSVDKLNLHPSLVQLMMRDHGLVLITGPTGSGKSTTLAALIEEVNGREAKHIVTIESPIEYVLASRRSLIRQREVGRDTPTVAQALIDSLREDPDILMVGEMRDFLTIQTAITAAETGHLVLSTLHTNTAAQSIDRIIDSFPSDAKNQLRLQLASSLLAVVTQRLVRRADGKGRALACEILTRS